MTSSTDPKIVPDLFLNRARAAADKTAVLHKEGGQWRSIKWKEVEQTVRDLARGLSDWVAPKDKVCILAENCPKWWFADLAVLCLGGVTAPIYPTNPPKDIAYVINDCGARTIFVSNAEQLEKIEQLQADGKLPDLAHAITFDDVSSDHDWVVGLSQVLKRNKELSDPIEERLAGIGEDDLFTLMYTSGTTGEPKGVMLTHRNLVSNVLTVRDVVEATPLSVKRMLSFLPLSHSLERMAGYYAAIYYGFEVAFAEGIPELLGNMADVKPSVLVSVPRIYEKVYAAVVGSAQTGLKRLIVNWAIGVGKQHAHLRLADQPIPPWLQFRYNIAFKLVFSKLHAKLGGRFKFAISGGAPLATEIAHFLNAAGITVYEGYGLTETAPVLSASRPGAYKVGSVGTPFEEIEIKIEPEPDYDKEGEIVARGPNIMKGYYNKPVETAEVLDDDGWFRTGDIGYFDDEGFLFITDRKKELLKTAGGKYVAPQPIENELKVHSLIEQAVVVGNRRKYCVALIVPDFEALNAKVQRPLSVDLIDLNADAEVLALFQQAVDGVNADRGSWEQLKRFHLLPALLSQETGELTPTMKLKRRVIDEKYASVIDALFEADTVGR